MNPRLLFCAFLFLSLTGRADVVAPPGTPPPPDIFKPDWLAGYLPPSVLVLKGKHDDEIWKLFEAALARVQGAKAVEFAQFPENQPPPKIKSRKIEEPPPPKSADAGFLVLVSQTGKVAAIYVAFSTDEGWTKGLATAIAQTTYQPAKLNGRPVPILVCVRRGFIHQISIN